MSEGQLLALVSLIAALVLVGSGLRARRMGGRQMLVQLLIWGSIFLVVTLAFSAIG